MSNMSKSLNDAAWEKLFDKYNILSQISDKGRFEISASQIKEFREPRLMAKFDHTINLPQFFADNQLAILPITRAEQYVFDERQTNYYTDAVRYLGLLEKERDGLTSIMKQYTLSLFHI